MLKHSVRVHQHPPESVRCLRIVGRVLQVLGEGNRMLHFYRDRMDVYADAQRGQTALILAVELGNRLGAQRSGQTSTRLMVNFNS